MKRIEAEELLSCIKFYTEDGKVIRAKDIPDSYDWWGKRSFYRMFSKLSKEAEDIIRGTDYILNDGQFVNYKYVVNVYGSSIKLYPVKTIVDKCIDRADGSFTYDGIGKAEEIYGDFENLWKIRTVYCLYNVDLRSKKTMEENARKLKNFAERR